MRHALETKLYYSISEVAETTDLKPHTLRAWEKEFSCLRPRRVRGKNRAYRARDIGIVLLIKRLLYEERYTIQGVRQKLKRDAELLRRAVEEVAPRRSGDGAAPAEVCMEFAAQEGQAREAQVLRQWVESLRKDLKEVLQLLS